MTTVGISSQLCDMPGDLTACRLAFDERDAASACMRCRVYYLLMKISKCAAKYIISSGNCTYWWISERSARLASSRHFARRCHLSGDQVGADVDGIIDGEIFTMLTVMPPMNCHYFDEMVILIRSPEAD